ncbi:type II secretion system protein GspD [Emcibacter nanhaiensis]|uniref:Type II secretion system protein GspD n=2 Tax=Emcibacter nanhaiensis TaxID=1505037 RepID=A0A501PQ41_9PROT|nr:type II secretion system protein GspD [Emcibacter nanhaiensis]
MKSGHRQGSGRDMRKQITRYIVVLAALITAMATEAVAQNNEPAVLNYRQADIKAVTEDISLLTGRSFIIDPRVSGKVTIISREPVERAAVLETFLSTLKVHGLAVLPTPGGAYKIVPEDQAAVEGQILSRRDKPTDQMVTEVIKLRHLDVTQASNMLKTLVGKSGRVLPYRPSNVLILVDFAPNVERLKAVLAEVDKSRDVVRMISLSNTSPSEMAEILEQLKSASGAENAMYSGFSAVPVDASDTLMLKGDQKVIDELMPVIEQLDARRKSKGDLRVVKLNHTSGETLLPVLQEVSQSLAQSKGENAGGGRAGKTSISLHPSTNSLVINADPEMQKALGDVIRQLDVPRDQIMVEGIIVEVSDTTAKELGLQYFLSGSQTSGVPFVTTNYSNSTPNILASAGALLAADELGEDSDALAALQSNAIDSILGINGFAGGLAGKSSNGTTFGFILNALDEDITSNILSTPSVITIDNEEARILGGQEIPITTGETLSSNNSNPFRTVNREDIGVKLTVRPQINGENGILAHIQQEVSSVAGTISSQSTDLITNKREVETTVMLQDGEIMVLGGLIQQDESVSISGVPLLKDIPVLGEAFKSRAKSREQRNLMIFLRMTIIRDKDQLRRVTNKKYDFFRNDPLMEDAYGGIGLDGVMNKVIGATPAKPEGE